MIDHADDRYTLARLLFVLCSMLYAGQTATIAISPMSTGSIILIFPEVILTSGRLSGGLLEVVALAVVEEELVFDLDSVFDDDAEGEVVNGPALETSGRELQDGGVLLREVLLDGSIAVAGDGPVVLKTVF